MRNLSYRNEHGRGCRERGRSVDLVVEPAAEWAAAPEQPPRAREQPLSPPSVFVSYRRSDAKMMVPALARDLGRQRQLRRVDIFLDLDDIRAGNAWRHVLDRELRRCTLLLAVIGPGWLSGFDERRAPGEEDLVQHEIATALRRGTRVLPVLVDTPMPRTPELAPELRDLANWQGFAFDLAHYPSSIRRLAEDIGLHLR